MIPLIDQSLVNGALTGQIVDGREWLDVGISDNLVVNTSGLKYASTDPTGASTQKNAIEIPPFTEGTLTGEAFLQISGTGNKNMSLFFADNIAFDNQLAGFELLTPAASPFTGATTLALSNATASSQAGTTITGGTWIPFTLTLTSAGYSASFNGVTVTLPADPIAPAAVFMPIFLATSPATRQCWLTRNVQLQL